MNRAHLMTDMIFVSMENWDEVWRRNQFLVAEFACRAPQQRILFVGLPEDISHALRSGQFASLLSRFRSRRALQTAPGFPNIFLLNSTKWLPNSLSWGRTFNRWLERRQIARACRLLGIERPLLWLNPHYAVHLTGQMGEHAVVYDITDDWTTLTQSERERQQVIAEDAVMLQRADLVIVCSERLYALKQGRARRLCLVPNGVEAERYRLVYHRAPDDPCTAEADRVLPIPPPAQAWSSPVFGYTGTLHPDRVDVSLIEALARRYPQGTVALIGPVQLAEGQRACLERLPNVRLVGAVPYQELPAWMRAFDVCIVPHRVTAFTESLNPLKLFEYLAAGLSIVSTDVAGFRDYGVDAQPNAQEREEGRGKREETSFPTPNAQRPMLVYIARGGEGAERTAAFLAAAEKALAEQEDTERATVLCAARQTEAARHSWQSRADTILQEVAALHAGTDAKGSNDG
jgi:glycosyltransferase involved in cell wall biosynthesis